LTAVYSVYSLLDQFLTIVLLSLPIEIDFLRISRCLVLSHVIRNYLLKGEILTVSGLLMLNGHIVKGLDHRAGQMWISSQLTSMMWLRMALLLDLTIVHQVLAVNLKVVIKITLII
jgi:hypothetical protein